MTAATFKSQQLARIHDVIGIDGLFDAPHQFVGCAMFGAHVFLLTNTDPVLAADGSRQFDGQEVDFFS